MAENTLIEINKEKCIKCGLCSDICPCNVINFEKGEYPEISETNIVACMKCQHCFSICPAGAITFEGVSAEESCPFGEIPSEESMLNLIKKRRSCRNYKDENVSPEIIKKLTDMTAWVPTGCNDHRLHFSVIDDKDELVKLKQIIKEEFSKTFTKLRLAKEFISHKDVKIDYKKFVQYKRLLSLHNDIIFRGAPHLVVVAYPKDAPCGPQDSIIALSYFELYAQTLGLGTLWCGMAQWLFQALPKLCKHIDLPKNYKPGYVMLFGYSKENYKRTTKPACCSVKHVKIK